MTTIDWMFAAIVLLVAIDVLAAYLRESRFEKVLCATRESNAALLAEVRRRFDAINGSVPLLPETEVLTKAVLHEEGGSQAALTIAAAGGEVAERFWILLDDGCGSNWQFMERRPDGRLVEIGAVGLVTTDGVKDWYDSTTCRYHSTLAEAKDAVERALDVTP